MEQEHTQHSASSDEPLSLPHFVDERTVQLARPVVPLKEVRATNRSRKLVLAGALILAAGVGAVTASFIYSQRSEPQAAGSEEADSTESVDNSLLSPSGEASGSSLGANSAAAQPSAPAIKSTDSAVTEINRQNTVNVKKPVVRESKDRNTANPADNSSTERYWDDRQAEEIERRRQRREARRLKRERRAEQRRTQDLTRIREIFEGSPRP